MGVWPPVACWWPSSFFGNLGENREWNQGAQGFVDPHFEDTEQWSPFWGH